MFMKYSPKRAKFHKFSEVRSKPYKLKFDIYKNRKVVRAQCTCTEGANLLCKHGSALFQFVNWEQTESKTDLKSALNNPGVKPQNMHRKPKEMAVPLGLLSQWSKK